MTWPATYPAAAPTNRTRMAPFMTSTPRQHFVGRPQPLQEPHEGEAVPASRPAAPVVVGPGRDPDRLPAVLPEPVQLGDEGAHRPVLGLLPPLLHVLADRVLPHGRDAISGDEPAPSQPAAGRAPGRRGYAACTEFTGTPPVTERMKFPTPRLLSRV